MGFPSLVNIQNAFQYSFFPKFSLILPNFTLVSLSLLHSKACGFATNAQNTSVQKLSEVSIWNFKKYFLIHLIMEYEEAVHCFNYPNQVYLASNFDLQLQRYS